MSITGFLDDIIGSKKTIQITNFGFIIACFIAFIAPVFSLDNLGISGESLFWFSGCLIGIFAGPNQAASRSLIGRFMPQNKENEFYVCGDALIGIVDKKIKEPKTIKLNDKSIFYKFSTK